jgi:hypothetical protein
MAAVSTYDKRGTLGMQMIGAQQEGLASRPVVRLLRRAVPWILLGVVGFACLSYYTDYKEQAAKLNKPAAATTAKGKAATAKGKAAAAPSMVMAVTEVNWHKEPSAASDTIRLLRKDEKLTLVSKDGTWYKVTDASGQTGYLTASDQYTKLVPAGK